MILIINKSTLEVASWYDGEANQAAYGGPWGDPNQFAHMELPEGMDRACLDISLDGDEVVIEADAAAEAARDAAALAAAWDAMRAERNRRLSACDYTQLADAPLDAGQKAAWASHRQDLRDLPENTVDPLSPSWPSEPA